MLESWREAVMATGGALLAVVTWVWRREVKRIDGKADRSEVTALAERIEKHHDALMARIDKSNDEASKKRERMYDKIELLTAAVNRHMGAGP